VAALAVIDDILSVLTITIFYSHGIEVSWLLAGAVAIYVLYLFNRWRLYAAWPYAITTFALGVFLHFVGVHAALAGIVLAVFIPTTPTPSVASLLAQAATALTELDHAQKEAKRIGADAQRIKHEPIWEWASRNLSAATDRLLSPADRIEKAVAPWVAYAILPLFAFSATGINLNVDYTSPHSRQIILGVILGMLIGKTMGITLGSLLAVKLRLARAPEGVTAANLLGAACLCGLGGTVSLLLADQAFAHGPESAIAKIGVLVGSLLAAVIGAGILVVTSGIRQPTMAKAT
jgi:NhaA family Na+:H+ antiporter